MEKEVIEYKISKTELMIEQHHQRLETESLWLFIATLGCWSINNPIIAVIALFIVLLYFADTITREIRKYPSFPKMISEIERTLKEFNSEDDWKLARKYQVNELRKSTSIRAIIKVWRFIIATAFWGITLFYRGM